MKEQGYFMFSNEPMTKSKQNCVAFAAYCADEKLFDEAEDRHHQFEKHEVQPISFIMKPSHAPEWVTDRERLWNEVKKIEKGSNWRTHRSLKLSLPLGIPKDDYVNMTKEFVKENLTDQGIVADVHLHLDKAENPHVHILCTVRPFHEDGTWADKKKNIPKLDQQGNEIRNQKGWKVYRTVPSTAWDTKDFLENQRGSWARIHNKYAERNQINKYFDHRSYARQGIDKEATRRLSRRNYELEKKEKERCDALGIPYKPLTQWGEYNEEVRRQNEVIQEKEKIEKQQATTFKAIYEKKIQQFHDSLNDMQKQSLKTVIRKAKNRRGSSLGDIGYFEAKQVYQSLDELNSKWFDYLNREKIDIHNQKDFYQLMVKKFKENPSFVAVYGLPKDVHEFMDINSQKHMELKEKSENFRHQFMAYSKEKESASFVFRLQKTIVDQSFEDMYGVEIANQFTSDEKAFAIREAVNGNYVRVDRIRESYLNDEVSTQRIDYLKLAKQYHESFLISDRTVNKLNRVISQNKGLPVTENYVNLLKAEKIRDYYQSLLDKVEPLMAQQIQSDLKAKGKDVSIDQLRQMSAKDMLLTYYNDDLMKDQQKRNQEAVNEHFNPDGHQYEYSRSNDLISGMLDAARQLEKNEQAKTKEKKAKKNRKPRHRDDDLYLE
jgi:hypothetical protein